MQKSTNQLLGASLICAITLAVAGATWAEFLSYSGNTLIENGNWIVSKKMAKVDVAGGTEFLIRRTSLAGGVLNLGSWHGYQEIILQKQIYPELIRFKFKIDADGYLAFMLKSPNGSFSGFLLSRNSLFPSSKITWKNGYRAINREAIEIEHISSGWNDAEIRFSNLGATLSVNGNSANRITNLSSANGHLAFRSGLARVYIDDIFIKDQSGFTISEKFMTRAYFWELFVLVSSVLVALCLLIFAVWRYKYPATRRMQIALYSCTAFGLSVAVSGASLFAYDFFHWSHFHYTAQLRTLPEELTQLKKDHIESARLTIVDEIYRFVGSGTISQKLKANKVYPRSKVHRGPILCEDLKDCRLLTSGGAINLPAKSFRILFTGSSQTVGAGAGSLEDTFFARTHRELYDVLQGTTSLVSLNLSVSASNSSRLAPDFIRYLERFKPDIAVINLSNNDRGNSQFGADMSVYLQACIAANVLPVLLLEAADRQDPNLLANHRILRNLGRKFQVPVLDLHGYMHQEKTATSGFLWWDFFHMTSHGQQLAAEWLSPQLIQMTKAIVSNPEYVQVKVNTLKIDAIR